MRRDWGIIRSLLSKIEAETLAEFVLGLHSDVMLGDGGKDHRRGYDGGGYKDICFKGD